MGIGDSRYRSRNIIITVSVFLIGFLCWSIMLQDLYSKRMAHLHEHYHLDIISTPLSLQTRSSRILQRARAWSEALL